MGYILLVTALTLNATANILLKMGAGRVNLKELRELSPVEIFGSLIHNYYLLAGLVLFALNVVFYFGALNKLNLSIAYPIMMAGGVLIITFVSVFFLRETLTTLQMVGIFLIAIGITFVAYHSHG